MDNWRQAPQETRIASSYVIYDAGCIGLPISGARGTAKPHRPYVPKGKGKGSPSASAATELIQGSLMGALDLPGLQSDQELKLASMLRDTTMAITQPYSAFKAWGKGPAL